MYSTETYVQCVEWGYFVASRDVICTGAGKQSKAKHRHSKACPQGYTSSKRKKKWGQGWQGGKDVRKASGDAAESAGCSACKMKNLEGQAVERWRTIAAFSENHR